MAWRALWRPWPSLALGCCAVLALLYFLAAVHVPLPPLPGPGRVLTPSGAVLAGFSGPRVLPGSGVAFHSRRPLENSSLGTGDGSAPPVPPGYLVFSPSCRIPDTDPYHPSLQKLVTREDPVVCSALPPLTSTKALPPGSGAGGGRLHVLRLDTSLLPKYTPRFFNNVTCCYQVIRRIDPDLSKAIPNDVDDKYKMGRCEDLVSEAQLEPEAEFCIVRCSANRRRGASKKVYTNVHAVVAPKKTVRAKLRENPERPPGDPRLSVLIVGVDSVSRLNYFRTMPRTSDLLRASGWYELRGYNKVEDNTFPNLMAILTGMTRPQVEKLCFKTPMTPMDNCPILWRNFSRAGYVTAYVEDEPTIGTFNYKKIGFTHAPTDYYLRPFLLAAQEHLEVRHQHNLNVCLGPSTAAEHILGYAASMASILRDHLYFALFWMNSFSHNSVNSPSSMDERLFQFWYDLIRSGALNKTMVLFLSDHGMRFGKIRETEVGWLEERLPFINVWLPEAFRAAYPELARGLRANQDRLTTPWDLHVTLRDVLERPWARGQPPSAGNVSVACPRCSSLFAPVPRDRGCVEVAVDPHWCTCYEYNGMSTEDRVVRRAATFVVKYIVDKLQAKSPNFTSPHTYCAPLLLNRVMSVRRRQDVVDFNDYIIIFETIPGKAVFETTVRNPGANADFELLGSISRINEFWEHSQCIHSADLKKYCHCTYNRKELKKRLRRVRGV